MFDKSLPMQRPSPTSSIKSKSQWSLGKSLGFRKSAASSTWADTPSSASMARTPSPTSDSSFKPEFCTPRVQPMTQLAHTPPSEPTSSIYSTSLPSLSTHTLSADTNDCCFCDIPLHFTLESEKIAKLRCTHLAHYECLVQLTKVLNQARNNVEKLRLPPCGMCDEPSRLSNKDLHAQFVKAIQDDVSASIAKQPSLSKLQQAVAPVSQTTKRSSIAHACSHKECNAVSCELKLFTNFSSVLPASGPAQIKCLVCLSAPSAPFLQPTSSATYKENALMLHEISCLRELSFKAVKLNTLNLNRLRFIHKFRVSSDMYSWALCNVFLFETLLVITHERGGATEVRSIYNLQEHVFGVKITDRGTLPYLQIQTQSASGQKQRIYLVDDDNEPIFALCAALHDGTIQFPMAPTAEDTHLSSVCEYTGNLVSRSPINIILCIEMPSTPRQAHALAQALGAAREKMSNFDRCGLVMQGPDGVVTSDFQRKDWSGWAALEAKFGQLSLPLDVIDFDKTLNAAERLLRNFRVERSLAAVVVISSTNTACISEIATGFVYSDTPIITIGMDNCYDHFALDTIACKTDGYFISCESARLKQYIKSVYKYVSSRTHKNLEVRLTPVDGCVVSGIEGWCAEPIYTETHKVSSAASDVVYRCTSNGKSSTVPLGSLSEQTSKSFIVTLDIADCATIDRERLLEVAVSSRSPLSTLHHRCQFQTMLSAPEVASESIDLFRRQTLVDTCAAVKEICALFESGQHKLAFKHSIATQSRLAAAKLNTTDPHAAKQMQAVLGYVEQFFDEFSDKLFQTSSHSALLSDWVAFRWYGGVTAVELLHRQTKI